MIVVIVVILVVVVIVVIVVIVETLKSKVCLTELLSDNVTYWAVLDS